MMKLIIREAQEKGSFAFVPKERESFDVGVIGTGRRKGTWDRDKLTTYEVQTTAIKSSIQKATENKYNLIFITNRKETKNNIRRTAYKVIPYKNKKEEFCENTQK